MLGLSLKLCPTPPPVRPTVYTAALPDLSYIERQLVHDGPFEVADRKAAALRGVNPQICSRLRTPPTGNSSIRKKRRRTTIYLRRYQRVHVDPSSSSPDRSPLVPRQPERPPCGFYNPRAKNCMENNYFTFASTVWKQCQGPSDGNPSRSSRRDVLPSLLQRKLDSYRNVGITYGFTSDT